MISAPNNNPMLLTDLLDRYRVLRLAGRSPKTLERYRVTLRHFDRFLERPATIADLTDDTLAAFQTYLANGRSRVTVNIVVDKLAAIWRFAARKGIVQHWPDICKLPEPQTSRAAWKPDQLEALIRACKETPGTTDGLSLADCWVALHYLIYDSGERIGAVLQLEWPEVDLEDGWVTFLAKTRKRGLRDKTHRLHPRTVEALGKLKAFDRVRVFPWGENSGVWKSYEAILRRAGLPYDRRSKFHRMRRTVATYLKAAGGNPTELLDHSDPRLAELYIDETQIERQHAADVLPSPLRNEPAVPQTVPAAAQPEPEPRVATVAASAPRRSLLRRLWDRVAKKPEPPATGRIPPRVRPRACHDSLLEFLIAEFLPGALAGRRPATFHGYRVAVYKLQDFVGRDVGFGDFEDGDLLNRFDAWLAGNVTNEVRGKYVNRIQTILDYRASGRLPRRGRHKGGAA